MNRNPRKKKQLSLGRDRRYAHGNSPHARNLSRSKRRQEHRFRQRLRGILSQFGCVESRDEEGLDSRLGAVQRPPRPYYAQKTRDISLAEKLKRRELRLLQIEVWKRRRLDPPLDVRLLGRLKGQRLHPVAIKKICQLLRRMTGLGDRIDCELDAPGASNFDLPLLRRINRLIRQIPVPLAKGEVRS